MAEKIILLITGFFSLIPTAIAAYFAIKNFILATKEKSSKEIWTLIMRIADAAMKEAEKAAREGLIDKAAKKQMVILTVKAGCREAGIDIDLFIDQLSDYIDETIAFVNSMKDKK